MALHRRPHDSVARRSCRPLALISHVWRSVPLMPMMGMDVSLGKVGCRWLIRARIDLDPQFRHYPRLKPADFHLLHIFLYNPDHLYTADYDVSTMTSNILLSSPPEIVLRILNSCDTLPQLIPLISTCKRLHSIWLSNMSTIIWHVGRESIPAFRYALVAVSEAAAS